MVINAYLTDGTYLSLSNGIEFKIPMRLVKALMSRGVRIRYKYRKSA